MKIAYITAGAGGMICGNCLRDNTLARALIGLGHDVQLIPTYTPIRTDEENVSLDRVFLGGINVYLQSYLPFLRHAPGFVKRLWDHPALLGWVAQRAVKTQPEKLGGLTVSVIEGADGPHAKEVGRLVEWLGSWRPDVVHLTNSMLGGIAPAVRRELEIPVVCSLQGEDYFLSKLASPHQERAFEALRKAAESVDVFVAPCHDHAAAMAPLLGVEEEAIRVVRPGIDLAGFEGAPSAEPRGDAGEFVVGYLARVCPEKGLHLLAEAVHHLRSRQPAAEARIRLRVAGWLGAEHGPYLEEVRRQIRAWGFEDDFEYLGTIDREAKLDFLKSLDVLCVPACYRAPKGAYVLEALASGVPVVEPRLGVFPEWIEATGGGLLFEPEDVQNLAGCLERLLENPEEAAAMGRQGQDVVRARFSNRHMAEEMLGVYRGLSGSHETAL